MLIKVYLRRALRFAIFGLASWIVIGTNFGLLDYIKFSREITILEKRYKVQELQRAQLLRLVRDLSEPTLDISLLEIQVRKVLSYGLIGEEIYFWK